MQEVLFFILLTVPVLYGVTEDDPRNSGNSGSMKAGKSYAAVIIESSQADNITEISGNPQEVELIEGDYSGNGTKPRTARRYYGGRRGYGRRYYSYYSPRRRYYYYGGYYGRSYGYYGGYGYGYGYGRSLYNLCYNWV